MLYAVNSDPLGKFADGVCGIDFRYDGVGIEFAIFLLAYNEVVVKNKHVEADRIFFAEGFAFMRFLQIGTGVFAVFKQ
ncbi:hypothetical protein [Fibrobacter sp. UWR4]|uniref:hypothetical protein n=1 Tax=Fibrobacter sp. UWR4 TaxID=1896218 RepID=UPI001304AB99|nr:hypothetical protein [Fibrobacter sp. UWR4]